MKTGVYKYHFELDDAFFEAFSNDDLRSGNVEFDVRLDKSEHATLFYFRFSGVINGFCDRCLGELPLPVSGEETLKVSFRERHAAPQVADDNPDEVWLDEGENKIDLAQWMYEYVAVALPMHRVHKEGECDSETTCFISDPEAPRVASDDVDPRWAALLELK
ncbi:MAG: DUF177 domain-containing protein [Bacteroidales bacterium]|nr:DUF177 domain-containing protein [Bacteroidales bacterium]